ncbi:transporter, auxin efflux carrier family protein [Candidatus Stoquefichus sp. KLE1796]|nr:transporter, auxin efflux carrier family protein [Candidatus Stoquefichus sp. KLE1796]
MGIDMFDVLIKSLTFILIIVIGYTLKKVDVLKKSDANVVATIIMNITLPCALLTSANGIELDATILILIAIGIISNVVMMIIGYIASIKDDAKMKGAFMINTSGYNIGNFVLPFVQSFFPGMGVVYLCSFDIGNALMGLGMTYAVADHVASGENHFDIKELFKKLFSSIPFDVYVLIFILAIFKLQIPSPILTIASTIGAGNSFLAMLMIGLMLEIKVSPLEAKNVFKILGLRMVGTIVVSLLTLFLPIPLLAKQIMIMAYCAPLSTVSAVFTRKIGYQGDMSATANSLSILVSIVCMVVLLLLFI